MEYLTVKQIAEITRKNEETIRRKIRKGQEKGTNAKDTLTAQELTSTKEGYRVSVDELLDKKVITKDEFEEYVFRQTTSGKNTDLAELLLEMDEIMNRKRVLIDELMEKKKSVMDTESEITSVESEVLRIKNAILAAKKAIE